MERVMKFVVYEPGRETRALLCEHLSTLGFKIAPFGDAQVAFLFLLGRLDEIDGAIVNVGDLGGPWLMKRLGLLGEPLAVVTYCEADAERAAIEESLHAVGCERLSVREVHVFAGVDA
jgi:hypothetical protein